MGGRAVGLAILWVVFGCGRVQDTTVPEPLSIPASAPRIDDSPRDPPPTTTVAPVLDDPALLAAVADEFAGRKPRAWGYDVRVPGLKTRLDAEGDVIALTLDACGGAGGRGYDHKLIDYLRVHQIPATLFVTGRWIAANEDHFAELARDPLFTIESHGARHRPCSVTGRRAYRLAGTTSAREVVDEIAVNAVAIARATGRAPLFYRSGTAHFDEVCVEIAARLGESAVSFTVAADSGARLSRAQVRRRLLAAPPGSIVLLHMNHPEGATAEGTIDALPELLRRGVRFVRLDEVGLR